MNGYLARLIDPKLDVLLKTFGAVLLEGPKWTGKTMTCEQRAKSAFYFTRRPGEPDPLALARLDSSLVFAGESPRLIDEWQLMPEVWDMTRSECDSRRGERGLYLLTGSSVPPQKKAANDIRHSGAGRIARVRMSTMTLFETGDSSAQVSLSELFEGEGVSGTMRKVSLAEIIHFIIRGGWPGNLDVPDSSLIPKDYVERIYTSELDKLSDNARVDRQKFRRFVYSLARNESTVCSVSTLAGDASINSRPLDDETVTRYLDILDDMFLLDDQLAYSPTFRSRTRLKIGAKRHFCDSSIPAAVVGANEKNLLKDLRFLGFLFESLAEHDLRIYAQVLGGQLYHYQDYDNDEVDAVIVLDDGRYALVEIKLGYENVVDGAARSLLKVASKLERKPEFLAIISGTAPAPVRRGDGVFVLPLTSLRP